MTLVDNVTTSVASDKTGGCFLHNLSRSYHVRPAYDVIGLNNDIGNDCNGWRRGGVRRSRLKYLAVAVGGAASSTAKSPADALVVSAATDKTAAKAALTGSNGRICCASCFLSAYVTAVEYGEPGSELRLMRRAAAMRARIGSINETADFRLRRATIAAIQEKWKNSHL
jgi:hypothetical protein